MVVVLWVIFSCLGVGGVGSWVVLGGLGSLGVVGVVFGLGSFRGLFWGLGWVVVCWVGLWSFLGSWGVFGCGLVSVCVVSLGVGWWFLVVFGGVGCMVSKNAQRLRVFFKVPQRY